MGYVDLETWKKYATKRPDDAAGEALYQIYLDAAESIVEEYLSYSPVVATYTHTFKGSGTDTIQLKAKPVSSLTSVTIDGATRIVSDFTLDGERMTDKTGAIFSTGSTIVVVYIAGFTTVPADIQLVVMEIASLKSMGSGDNIGVTSTSFDGGNSRTFINYTNFKKYLAEISGHRVVRM